MLRSKSMETLRKLRNNCITGGLLLAAQLGILTISVYLENYFLTVVAGICGVITICSFCVSYKCYMKVKER